MTALRTLVRSFRLALLGMLLAASPSLAATLAERIDEVIRSSGYNQAHWGVLVADLESGEVLYERQPDHLFVPASVTKAFSVAAALDALGPDYRFRTPVYATGKVSDDGRLDGDLILVASGDPTLGGRDDGKGGLEWENSDHTYAGFSKSASLTAADPLAGLDALAQQVKAAGITRVGGDVRIDARLFDPVGSTGSGPRTLTSIVLNDNVFDVEVSPTTAGQPAQVVCRPRLSSVEVDARVSTVAAGKSSRISVSLSSKGLVVRGQIAEDHKPMVEIKDFADPVATARAAFIDALARAGITVEASALTSAQEAPLPKPTAYAQHRRVAELVSPPFSEHAKLILKVSHNLHATELPVLLALKHGERTLSDGMRREAEFFKRAGVDPDTISFGSGAGGSNADWVTPRATVQLLRYMKTHPAFETYRDAMPVLGIDGTTAQAVPEDSPARGHFQAKTGTRVTTNLLNGRSFLLSKALAGYGTTAAGKSIAFASFVNDVHLTDTITREHASRTLGKLCEAIHAKD